MGEEEKPRLGAWWLPLNSVKAVLIASMLGILGYGWLALDKDIPEILGIGFILALKWYFEKKNNV